MNIKTLAELALAPLVASLVVGCGSSSNDPVEPASMTTSSTGSGGEAGSSSTSGGGGSGGAPDACADLSAQLQAALDTEITDQKAPGGAARVVLPDCSWSGASGLSDKAGDVPMEASHQFFGASLTKTFTAVTVLMLVAEGKVGLDDPVTDHVPSFPDAANVTVRQLLNHTSGLFNYAENSDFTVAVNADLDKVWTPEELLAFAAGQPPTNAPGTFHYSGTNTILAGMVIEAATGSKVAAEFRARILEPLGLESTYLAGFEAPAPGTLSHGYNNGQDITSYFQDTALPTTSWTTGSIVTTLDDIGALFDALLVKETLLEPEEMVEMKTFVDTDALFKMYLHVPGYGLGIVQRTTAIGEGIGNGGSSGGWLSRAFYVPERQASVSVFLNSGTDDPEALIDALFDVIAERP